MHVQSTSVAPQEEALQEDLVSHERLREVILTEEVHVVLHEELQEDDVPVEEVITFLRTEITVPARKVVYSRHLTCLGL